MAKKRNRQEALSSYIAAGGGSRRFGKPRTDAERRKRHQSRYGSSKLPPRGTGLGRR